MPDLRRLISGSASPGRLALVMGPPAGLMLGALAWFMFAGSPRAIAALQGDADRLSALRLEAPQTAAIDGPLAEATGRPLFALTTGPGAVADVLVKLDGVARSSQVVAALLEINGGAAAWIDQGKSRDSVTVEEVLPSKVVLLTPLGRKEVGLGEAPAPAGAPAGQPTPKGPDGPSTLGFRLPPPPASAPGAP